MKWLSALDEAIKINPQDYDAWQLKGAALSNLGRYEEAIVSLRKPSQSIHLARRRGITRVSP